MTRGRNLASIQTVHSVLPIDNADSLEKIGVLGWWVVAKKGEHKVGDAVVYIEIDSLLPERSEFEFLRKSCFKPARIDPTSGTPHPAGFRIKTVKLRGQVSQGICFSLSILPEGILREIGADVTGALEITKWEPPIPVGMGGRVLGPFPCFIPKTDEIRIQAIPSVLSRHQGKRFFVTEKLDGTSFTAFFREGQFGVASRNLWLDLGDESSLYARMARELRLEEKLRRASEVLRTDIALQGELIGPGILKNKYALRSVSLRVFNLLDINTGRLMDRAVTTSLLAELGIDSVPELESIVLNHSVDELVAMAEGKSVVNPNIQREGIVLRPEIEEADDEIGGRLSFKVINPKFLLAFDE